MPESIERVCKRKNAQPDEPETGRAWPSRKCRSKTPEEEMRGERVRKAIKPKPNSIERHDEHFVTHRQGHAKLLEQAQAVPNHGGLDDLSVADLIDGDAA